MVGFERALGGVQLAVNEQNAKGGLLDRPVIMFIEDDEADGAVGVRKITKLIEENGCDLTIGSGIDAISLAEAAVVRNLRRHINIAYCANIDIVTKLCSYHNFANSNSGWVTARQLPMYLHDEGLIGNKFYGIFWDGAWGREVGACLKVCLPDIDSELVGESYVPMGTTDYSPILLSAKAAGANVIYTGIFSDDCVRCAKQFDEFGLKEAGIDLVIQNTEQDIGEGIGDAIGGTYGSMGWYYKTELASSQKFYEEYVKLNHVFPSSWAARSYESVKFYFEAVERAGSLDPKDVIPEMEDHPVQYVVPVDQRFRACDHRFITPYVIVKGKPPAEREEPENIYEILNWPTNSAELEYPCNAIFPDKP
jgi:branched-chain amino acid transport system substrate-binding protein